jgi:hypothetical protein
LLATLSGALLTAAAMLAPLRRRAGPRQLRSMYP